MTTTLVMAADIAGQIRRSTANPLETAGVLRVVVVEAPDGDLRLLARAIDWVPDASYQDRRECSLSIASSGYVPSLATAEAAAEAALWFHTHPGRGANPGPSEHDRKVDDDIRDLFRLRTASPYYGTLIASPALSGSLAFTGLIEPEGGVARPIDRIWEVEDQWRLTFAYDGPRQQLSDIFDRSVRAFGGAVQSMLAGLRIAIVGCGGTGSAVAEQLVRLGVRHLLLIDPDHLSASNITRVYGSTPADVGEWKVDVLKRHLSRIAPDLQCEIVAGSITEQGTARHLIGYDLVFGCTDDNAGRLILSRLPTYMMLPVIDLGVLLSSDQGGRLTGIDARVTTIVPGAACLLCRNRVDTKRAAAEMMVPEERERLAGEGYAPALPGVEPAVVSYTTAVAAAAVGELLERLVGYGPSPRPTEVLLRSHEREISTNIISPRARHYCHRESGRIGIGNGSPWLDQLWRT